MVSTSDGLIGRRIGHFQVDAPLGTGGMGVVYRALDTRLGRNVALKVVGSRFRDDPTQRARLYAEARAAAALNHPNIVTVYDVGDADGELFIAMEHVTGHSLRQLIRGGPMPAGEALRVVIDAARGLAAAHAHGVVHRDLKPENIMVADDGRVVVLDFGIAIRREKAPEGADVMATLTSGREVEGTPGYMAPEQLSGDRTDARTDLFALGVVLFELVTGRRAIEGNSLVEIAIATLGGSVTRPSALRSELPTNLDDVVMRLTAKDATKRYATAHEAAAALEDVRATMSASRARPTPPPQAAIARVRTNLVDDVTALIGRAVERNLLAEALRSAGLVTLHGAGGMGKTRLAREVGLEAARHESFGGGVWFCDLTEARTKEDVLAAVASTLEITLTGETTVLQEERVARGLGTRGALLLILDNVEQVVDASSHLIGKWLIAAPELRVLATSRKTLEIRAERIVPLPPFATSSSSSSPSSPPSSTFERPLSDGAMLFVERARRLRAGYSPDASATRAIEAIVGHLEGIPLAIELAAARTKLLAPEQLLARISAGADLLARGARGADGRQTTMRSVVEGSWNLLSSDEKSALAQCSVFAGPFSVDAAEAIIVLKDGTFVADALSSLIDKSLLHTNPSPSHRPSYRPELRLRIFEAVRAFAAEQLARGTDDEKNALTRHARHYVDTALALDEDTQGREFADVECFHFQAIRSRAKDGVVPADTELGALLALEQYTASRGPYGSYLRALDDTIARVGASVSTYLRGRALLARGHFLIRTGGIAAARVALADAAALAEEFGHDRLLDRSRCSHVVILLHEGKHAEAHAGLDKLDARRSSLAPGVAGFSGMLRVDLLLSEGRFPEARRQSQIARDEARRIGGVMHEALAIMTLGVLEHADGALDLARTHYRTAMEIFAASHRRREASVRSLLGAVDHECGRLREARANYASALEAQVEIGDLASASLTRTLMAALDHEEGHELEAEEGLAQGQKDSSAWRHFAVAMRRVADAIHGVDAVEVTAAMTPEERIAHRIAARVRAQRGA